MSRVVCLSLGLLLPPSYGLVRGWAKHHWTMGRVAVDLSAVLSHVRGQLSRNVAPHRKLRLPRPMPLGNLRRS